MVVGEDRKEPTEYLFDQKKPTFECALEFLLERRNKKRNKTEHYRVISEKQFRKS